MANSRPNAANDLDIANNEYKSYLAPQLFLEILLLKTRELAIKHSSAKRKEAKANQQKKKGLLVLIDFEKAFDSISWQFMNTCLVLFNFGEPFRQRIKLSTSDTKIMCANKWHDFVVVSCRKRLPTGRLHITIFVSAM